MPTGYLLIAHHGDSDAYSTFHAPTELEVIGLGAQLLHAVRPHAMSLATKPLAAIVEGDGYRFRVLKADYTEDGQPITPGARLFNYYDRWWGTIDPAQFLADGMLSPGGKAFDGWYDITRDGDSWSCKLNGPRLSTKENTP